MNDFESQISQFTEAIVSGVKDVVANAANAIADEAKQNASCDIADSISTIIGDDRLSATISANSPDAAMAEYGIKTGAKLSGSNKVTDQNVLKPFLNPAFEAQAPVFLEKIQEIISN